MRFILIIFFLLIYSFVSFDLLLKEPPVWPDEAIFADVALNMLSESKIKTNIFGDVVTGTDQSVTWYPPVYFNILAWWFKVAGVSIFNYRMISIVISVIMLIPLYLISKAVITAEDKFTNAMKSWLLFLPIILLLLDPTFSQASRIGRQETTVLFFGLMSVYFLLKSKNGSLVWPILAGLFSSLSVLTHAVGFFFFVSIILWFFLTDKLPVFKTKSFYLFVISFLFPLSVWAATLLPYLDILKEQYLFHGYVKNSQPFWVMTVLSSADWGYRLSYVMYLVTTLVVVLFSFYLKDKKYTLITLLLVTSWVFLSYGKTHWYAVHLLPFVYLLLTLLLHQVFIFWKRDHQNHFKIIFYGLIFIILLTAGINLYNIRTLTSNKMGDNYSYKKFTEEILKIIPDQAVVFLSSIPDPYFGFKENKRGNTLYEFSGYYFNNGINKYGKLLDKTDYIVLTQIYDYPYFGDFLPRYIENNKLEVYKIGEPLQYQAYIIKLKPPDKREAVN